ncbi:phytochelatin synthase family protein [Roseibium sp. SCP14]|uniref:phytochelatin synthase family protein n=1 Tax=Roseibium sp. SCP14 TaxID=3141375 RepID=UPI00333951C2
MTRTRTVFLILDVVRYKYPPVWVDAATLFDAMNTTDSDNNDQTRGNVTVGRSEQPPSLCRRVYAKRLDKPIMSRPPACFQQTCPPVRGLPCHFREIGDHVGRIADFAE